MVSANRMSSCWVGASRVSANRTSSGGVGASRVSSSRERVIW